jgi:hypothetical protein
MSSISIVINKLSTTASRGSLSDVPPMTIDMCGHWWKDNGNGKTKMHQFYYSGIKPGPTRCFTRSVSQSVSLSVCL